VVVRARSGSELLDNLGFAMQIRHMKKRRFFPYRSRKASAPKRFVRSEDIPAWLTALFTVVLAFYAYRAWEESTKTTKTLNDQLTAVQGQLTTAQVGQRAWVYADISVSVKTPRPNFGPGWLIPLNLTFHNVGHETALHVRPKVGIVIHGFGAWSEQPEQQQACEKTTDEFGTRLLAAGPTVFPGQTLTIGSYAAFSQTAWEVAIKETIEKSNNSSNAGLGIVGCILYEFATDHSIHTTYFAYNLLRHINNEGGYPLGPQLDQIDQKDFVFNPSIGPGSFDAD
jgi:hypothetical protein